jgi:hypothetical protein
MSHAGGTPWASRPFRDLRLTRLRVPAGGLSMHFRHWKRREVVTLLGGTEATWPIAAWAQPGKLPIIGRLPDARWWRAGIRGTKGLKKEETAPAPPGPTPEVKLLTEIRDLLKK